MTQKLLDLIRTPGPWLTAAQIAPLYQTDPTNIRLLAREGALPFEVFLAGKSRVKINKKSFVDWYESSAMIHFEEGLEDGC